MTHSSFSINLVRSIQSSVSNLSYTTFIPYLFQQMIQFNKIDIEDYMVIQWSDCVHLFFFESEISAF